MSYSTLEDFFGDIVGKARRGQGLSEASLGDATGLSAEDIGRIEAYELTPDESTIHRLADVLSLAPRKLTEVVNGWVPANPNEPFENERLTVDRLVLDAGTMEVNAYLMKDKSTGKGAIIDAGAQAERILAAVQDASIEVTHILLTHGHGDHVGALQEVKAATGAPVYCCEKDGQILGGMRQAIDAWVDDGWTTRVGGLDAKASSLPGHTPGGVGYGAEGVFFSGDALFAGSMGGAAEGVYQGQIEAVRTKVLTRDGGVRLFPGHGPLTTVEEERSCNPFFL